MVSATVVKAQTTDVGMGKVNWQLRGGLGCASLVGGVSNIGARVGYAVGGRADVALSRNGVWRVLPGLRLAQKGWAFDGYFGNEQIMAADYSTNLHYLELPVQLAVRWRLGRSVRLTLGTGPYVACGLDAKTRLSVRDTDYKQTFRGDHFHEACDFWNAAYDRESRRVAYPKFNRWEVGWTRSVDLTVGHFVVGGEVSCGLTPVCDANFMGNPVGNVLLSLLFGEHPKNLAMNFVLGYQF